ncbi:glutathione S-transferase family protein [Aquisediminimonas sediminicola]|uniref:glutathione S-transferase family protein n=1 Tax=Alteraquisediminimonas sediminicola TaxID=2676787 RepID=UPI001C8E9149|nr:glutathione S-transferase family protein [Aquisediminimonas sediminicola]
MKLFGSSFSPFVRKVMVYAAECGIALDVVPAGPDSVDPEFLKASPFKKIPALLDEDFSLPDSSAIIAYLDAKFPGSGLIPSSPQDRARTIWYEEYADSILAAGVYAIFFNRIVAPKFMKIPGDQAVADNFERDKLPALIDYLEGVVPASGFLVGDCFSLADIAVASPFVNFQYAGVNLDPARWPKVNAYLANILARPSFVPIIEKERRVLAKIG